MCIAIAVTQIGREDVVCETVAELASALGKLPSEVSPDPEDNCLCNARFDELGAINLCDDGEYAWPEYRITQKRP